MKLRKFEARTEQEAIEKVKEELGVSALILNIKKTMPKGPFAFFRKPLVEVTAACDDRLIKNGETAKNEDFPSVVHHIQSPVLEEEKLDNAAMLETLAAYQQKEKIKSLEQRLETAQGMLEKAISQLSVAARRPVERDRRYENNMMQVFYDALVEQGVTEEIAQSVLDDIADAQGDVDLGDVVKIVYNRLVRLLEEPGSSRHSGDAGTRVMFFIGPTGVGKTSTIAKLSSLFILSEDLNVGYITADTYRIAAVEQLKVYADILGIETEVVYNNEDLGNALKLLSVVNDVVMIDTAGRSHQNRENLEELEALLNMAPDSERFLVLSATTKRDDLLSIVEAYSAFTDFDIIFTKLDETARFGDVLNICCLTGKRVAYITNGQNVPDDIERMQPEKIAKALMGLEGVLK